MHSKVAVIGWDAATFDVVLPLVEAGALPNLESLMARGACGELISTLHPLSPVAWASFMTGVNPGKHGLYDFVGLEPSGRFRITNGADVKAETLWERVSKAGGRVVVVNVPMTYPPQAVNGCLISGMDAPQQDRAFAFPPELEGELQLRFGGYRSGVPARAVMLRSVKRFTPRYVDSLCDLTRLHGEVACHLLERYDPALLVTVFIAPDRIQHALGHLLAEGVHPDDGIGQVYRACDNALGRLLDRLDESWTVLLLSDHGARAYRRVFELGTWLQARGWLRLRPPGRLASLEEHLGPVHRRAVRLLGGQTSRRPDRERFLERVVWDDTKAFAVGAFGSIYVNTRDRFPNGVVEPGAEYREVCDEIAQELLAARDPETGSTIVDAVHRAEDVYQGPYLGQAPDLLIETADGYFVRNGLDHHEGRITYTAGRYRRRSLAHTGRHAPEGILVAAGSPFAAGAHLSGAHIEDIAPTVLHLGGLPVPLEMDGRPLVEWLEEGYRNAHPVEFGGAPTGETGRVASSYDEDDEAVVESRLRDLGYLG